jgi:hypothetical protein
MINAGVVAELPLASVRDESGGLSMRATGYASCALVVTPPLLALVTDTRRQIVFTVEIYPGLLTERITSSARLLTEDGGALLTEGGDPFAVEDGA